MKTFEENVISRLRLLEREVERLRVGDKADSAAFGRPVFLTTPLTSTSWDGDSFSTTAKTKIDLSTVFGLPNGIKAVAVQTIARDSASSTDQTLFFVLSPSSTVGSGVGALTLAPRGIPNDTTIYASGIVPCDSAGDIYYEIKASGTGTMDCWIRIWGWWL